MVRSARAAQFALAGRVAQFYEMVEGMVSGAARSVECLAVQEP